MRIAIFDYKVTPTNPAGSCLLRMLQGLCHEHEFTVFAVEFENPCPEHIRFVRVLAPTRPLVLLFLVYHLLAPLYYWAYHLRYWLRFDFVQIVESNLSFGDVSYAHFCHRAYLKYHWKQVGTRNIQGMLRWLDHYLRALFEPWVYQRAKHITVPSWGLMQELRTEYPFIKGNIYCISNPVDIEQMRLPKGFDRDGFRRSLRFDLEDIVLVFVALGHFERKGLPLLLEALNKTCELRLKLLVVGGMADLIRVYRDRAKRMGLGKQVTFVGMQRDVRPYLWGADAFVLPSIYETFSLVSFEAAAAGLPLIITPLYGVEELLRDGKNGFLVDRTPEGVTQGIVRFLALSPKMWRAMGKRAQQDVERYATKNFVAAWQTFYREHIN